jgi:hypothetical protein
LNARDELDALREKLIASLHSDKEAQAYFASHSNDYEVVEKLVRICFPYDYYSNDPRMEAAYYLSSSSIERLRSVSGRSEELLRLPEDGETMDGNISCHLVRCIERLISEAQYVPSPDIAKLTSQK